MRHRDLDQRLKEKIDQYVNGGLDEQEIDQLWVDLVQDGEGLAYLKSVADIDFEEKENEGVVEKIESSKKDRKYFYLAAAVILVLGAFTVFQFEIRENNQDVQPIENIELSYYRSAGSALPDQEPMLREAIELVNHGEPQSALRIIDLGIEQTSDNGEKALFLMHAGSVLYNNGNYKDAVSRFDRIVRLPGVDILMKERAYWYLGNTYFRLNEPQAAKNSFASAAELDGAYSRVAETYLNSLRETP